MKMVFLFDKEIRRQFNLEKQILKSAIPNFAPYDYGPFSSQVFEDLEFLVDLEFVKVRYVGDETTSAEEEVLEYEYWQVMSGIQAEEHPFAGEEEFLLSDIGKAFVEDDQAGTLSQEQRNALDEFKSRCTGASLRSLLNYVYTKYPKTTTKSLIRDEILNKHNF